jgi:hypothetical protein
MIRYSEVSRTAQSSKRRKDITDGYYTTKIKTYSMGMQISYSMDTKVSKEKDV